MLYLVPTPVGNLEDITLRAMRLFDTAQVILTEDGRQTSQLLKLLQIHNQPKLINLTKRHDLNRTEILEVLSELKKTQENSENSVDFTALLMTDSGTPGISDPAFEVVKLAQELGLKYSTLPGPTALIPAVVNSGLVFKSFWFVGFLPLKKGRQKLWQRIKISPEPVVIYESVHRLDKFLTEVQTYLEPHRFISFSREVSKLHEEIWTGKAADLIEKQIKAKGEFVWVIGGHGDSD